MKKLFITVILSVISVVGFTQNDSINERNVFCLNTPVKTVGYTFNKPKLDVIYKPTSTIDLKLNLKKGGYVDSDDRKKQFLCVLIAGLAFTTAAILEGGEMYGTYVVTKPGTATSSQQVSYVTPPLYKQTPRNIMLVFGVGLTITGGIGLVK